MKNILVLKGQTVNNLIEHENDDDDDDCLLGVLSKIFFSVLEIITISKYVIMDCILIAKLQYYFFPSSLLLILFQIISLLFDIIDVQKKIFDLYILQFYKIDLVLKIKNNSDQQLQVGFQGVRRERSDIDLGLFCLGKSCYLFFFRFLFKLCFQIWFCFLSCRMLINATKQINC
eukprot:TRINITY_DN10602_c0_g1_i1.p2 TRINITY_DN10602_c0_g1~~TRINITY_DN10602_c0_g1_i1.p2  ORF type:complete len:174 (-),score=1.77 TRINITY_DN10602_c0_g1_i1:542-1063(-)